MGIFCTRERTFTLRYLEIPLLHVLLQLMYQLNSVLYHEIRFLPVTAYMTVLMSQYTLKQRALTQELGVLYSIPSLARTLAEKRKSLNISSSKKWNWSSYKSLKTFISPVFFVFMNLICLYLHEPAHPQWFRNVRALRKDSLIGLLSIFRFTSLA